MRDQKESPAAGETARGAGHSQGELNPSTANGPPQPVEPRRRTYKRLRRLLKGRARLVVRSADPNEPAIIVALDERGVP